MIYQCVVILQHIKSYVNDYIYEYTYVNESEYIMIFLSLEILNQDRESLEVDFQVWMDQGSE